ncbi:hypothetical protein BpHYR1_001289, partial [Brachionus plicatilis]
RQDHFYFIGNDSLEWIKPTEKPYILIFHDESTFRSNEQSHSRWMKRDQYPFISKGKGKSLIVSDFLVAHCSCPFFYLNEDEWEKAIEKYPSLLESHGIKLSSCRHCPYDELKWVDDQLNEFSLSCFFQDGPLKGESKGLRQIALELGYELDPKIQ